MYERIMIVVDEGVVARAAVDEGLALARVHDAQVLFFHVLPNYIVPMDDMPPLVSLGPEKYEKAVRRAADRIIGAAARLAAERGVESTGVVGSGMDAAECIARAASQRGCDLIVVGSHGRTAIQRLIRGSVVTRLITLASVPLLVCKRPEKDHVRTGTVVSLPERERRSRAAAVA